VINPSCRARAAAAALLAPMLASCAVSPTPPPRPPCGVTADGVLTVLEWAGAQRIDVSGGVVLWLIQGPEHVCLAAETREARGFKSVDVFIADSAGVTHNLHASTRVGERTVPARWSDERPPTAWGQTTGWTANAAPPADAADTLFDGYEFIIARSRMPRPWRVRVEVRDPDGRARDIVWPAQSRRNDIRTWALLQ
jgi:hypothetical protein